jgi:hypothetical protein
MFICVADRHRYLVCFTCLFDFLDVLAVVSSVVMHKMEIKIIDDTIRDAVYLKVKLVDPSLKVDEVIRLLCTRRILLKDLGFLFRF